MFMIIIENSFFIYLEINVHICQCKLALTELTYTFNFKRMYNNHRYFSLRPYLITKIEYYPRYGHKFSHFSEMNFNYIINFQNTTYEHYLKRPKSMPELKLV